MTYTRGFRSDYDGAPRVRTGEGEWTRPWQTKFDELCAYERDVQAALRKQTDAGRDEWLKLWLVAICWKR